MNSIEKQKIADASEVSAFFTAVMRNGDEGIKERMRAAEMLWKQLFEGGNGNEPPVTLVFEDDYGD